MTLQEAFEKLAQRYGTHKAAALAIGYTPEHYRGLRNGRFPVPARTEKAILDKAAEIDSYPAPVSPVEPSCGAQA
jgi:hypothetical protein